MVKNKSSLWIGLGVLVVLIVGAFVWMNNSQDEEVIKIGVMLPMSGPAAFAGTEMLKGINIALEEQNKEGKWIEIILEDTQADPTKAVYSINKLIDVDKVNFIIGGATSGEVLAVSPIAEQKKVVYITPTGTALAISDAGDFIFRMVMTSRDAVEPLRDYILLQKFSRVGIIYANNEYGKELQQQLTESFGQNETQFFSAGFEASENNFRTTILKYKQADFVDAILIIGPGGSANFPGIVLKQINELGFDNVSKILSYDFNEDKKIFDIAGEEAVEGVVYIYLRLENNSDFYSSFKEKNDADPTVLSAISYDSLNVLSESISRCLPTAFSECVKNELMGISFIGSTGITEFDEKGDAKKELVLKKISNGKFIFI